MFRLIGKMQLIGKMRLIGNSKLFKKNNHCSNDQSKLSNSPIILEYRNSKCIIL